MQRRLAVARFWYEGNAFCPQLCTQAHFTKREWAKGSGALEAARGSTTELGAVVAFAESHPDWQVEALRCAAALPGGPIDEAVYQAVLDEVTEALRKQGPWDAVYLSLHGAAITTRRTSPDLDLVRAVRQILPGVPIGASFDMHANLSTEMGSLLDYASGYKTYPHVDMAETAEIVLRGLRDIAERGRRTRVTVVKSGLLLPSFNMRTDSGPMRDLQELAATQVSGKIVEAAVFGGFPYADTPDIGASVLLVSDLDADANGAAVQRTSAVLVEALHNRAPAFAVSLPSPDEGLAQALEIIAGQRGLVAVTDPGDNPYSGGVCDTPGLFSALLRAGPKVPTVFASFADPEAVSLAFAVGMGGGCTTRLGARLSDKFGEPVLVQTRVERFTDGVFRNSGPMETGVRTRCGRTVLLSLQDQAHIRIIVTETVAPANDPAFYALHGIDLEDLRLLCVKAKNHFRAAFQARCIAIIDVDAPGPACLDFHRLPFRHVIP